MQSVSEHYRKAATLEQLKNRKKVQERRDLEARRKVEFRRHIIIGELVCKYFPDVMKYQPQRYKKDNAKEFADFERFLQVLATDTEPLTTLYDRVKLQHS